MRREGRRDPGRAGDVGGSAEGVDALERAGEAAGVSAGDGLGDHIAFTDGRAVGDHPRLLGRPIAYSLFTLVVNADAGVQNLSLQQVRDIYAEKVTNWSDVGGTDLPVHLVNRHRGSGTRTALVERVLNGGGGPRIEVPEATAGDCSALGRDEPGRCEVGGTDRLLQEVADVPGALGYSEASSAAAAEDIVEVRIDGVPATLRGVEDGRYPYWQIEFAHTYGEPPAGSIAAAFLRYLTDQGGKDVLREFGDRPCSETRFPLLCEPAGS
ncbi:substrate-binding domain-containing protein [Actinomadura sp. CNU-125]|uniref:substrate-binding domain-containing protein n=1 Tax=Actinomadura sp. CNU-125 TaxID=1904961 RepID=UPI0021CD042D|nr:substrate-binding domain-containing protein [Actinomadura sp. CNU-125]